MNNVGFTRKRVVGALTALMLVGSLAIAQDDSGAASTGGAVPAATAPAEQNNIENPPLSGLDQPTAEPAFGGRSYLMPGFQVSESVDSNSSGSSVNSYTSEVTRALGSVDLQKIWRQSQFGLDYIAAGDFLAGPIQNPSQPRARQAHTLAAVERFLWRTGQLAIRDSFDYLPEGSFGFSSYGGAASFSSSLGGGVSNSGAGTGLGGGLGAGGIGSVSYGSFAYQPRIDNTAIVDITQGLSPRSTVTMAGAFAISHYLQVTNQAFPSINSQQAGGQIGYNHLLSRKDQIGVSYAFQEIHFPRAGTGSVVAHAGNLLYGHRISGKLNLTLAGGPQLVIVHHPPPASETKTVAANVSVLFSYLVSTRSNLQVAYRRYVTPGSGFYAGANTNSVRLSLGYRLGRHWTTMIDGGYSHNSSVLRSSSSTSGVQSNRYEFWYAGGSLQRQFGPHFNAFASYQFNDLGFASCSTGVSVTCGLASTRHTGMVGINWHPKPIRLD